MSKADDIGSVSERRFALIIATSEYQDSDLQKLIAPARDAEALSSVLKNPDIGSFDVKVVKNKAKHQIEEEIELFFSERHRNDLLLLYFSCHGIKDEDGRLYYAATNTSRRLLAATAISSNFVNEAMERSRARRRVLVLDCCYSGAFAKGMRHRADKRVYTGSEFEGRGRIILTASDAMQYSFEGDKTEGAGVRSVFTSAVVQGLTTGEADSDKNGVVSYKEIYDYAFERVRDETPQQIPGIWAFGVEGDVIIAKNPYRKPASLPPPPRPPALPRPPILNKKILVFIAIGAAVAILVPIAIGIIPSPRPETPPANPDNNIPGPPPTNILPTAIASAAPQTGQWFESNSTSNIVVLDGRRSSDPDGTIKSYSWSQTAGPTVELNGSETSAVSFHTPPVTYNTELEFGLTVTDNKDETGFTTIKVPVHFNGIEYSFVREWGSPGTGDGKFADINGIAAEFLDNPNIYVADSGNNRIQKFTNNGTFLTKWGSPGTGDSKFGDISGIAVDPAGNVYVADLHNGNVQKFDATGNLTKKWNVNHTGPYDIAVDRLSNIYISSDDKGNFTHFGFIEEYNSDGNFTGFFGGQNTTWLSNASPRGLVVDSSGSIYVIDSNQIIKFSNDGEYITNWGSEGTRDGELSRPADIAVDSLGNIYVADSGNNRIQKFTNEGKFIMKWGSIGSGEGEFNNPVSIALDPAGNTYVADQGNSRIQVFSRETPHLMGGNMTGLSSSSSMGGNMTGLSSSSSMGGNMTGLSSSSMGGNMTGLSVSHVNQSAGPFVNQSSDNNPNEKIIEIVPDSFYFKEVVPYNPLRVNITAGTEVIWLNQDGPPHTVVSGDPETGPTSEFRSGLIDSGKNFTHTFTKAGVYDYYDPTYRHMKGQVVVN